MSNAASQKALSYHRDGFQCIVPGTSGTVSVSTPHAESSVFPDGTTIVRLFSTVDCFVTFGINPVATTAGMFVPGGIIQFFGVSSKCKMSVLQNGTAGTLYYTPGA